MHLSPDEPPTHGADGSAEWDSVPLVAAGTPRFPYGADFATLLGWLLLAAGGSFFLYQGLAGGWTAGVVIGASLLLVLMIIIRAKQHPESRFSVLFFAFGGLLWAIVVLATQVLTWFT